MVEPRVIQGIKELSDSAIRTFLWVTILSTQRMRRAVVIRNGQDVLQRPLLSPHKLTIVLYAQSELPGSLILLANSNLSLLDSVE